MLLSNDFIKNKAKEKARAYKEISGITLEEIMLESHTPHLANLSASPWPVLLYIHVKKGFPDKYPLLYIMKLLE